MSESKLGDKVTWESRVNGYGKNPTVTRTGLFHHYIDHTGPWATEQARITNVDGTDKSVYVDVDRLKRAE